ncbi:MULTISPECIES: hypothetical protein [unclassified Paenibacillus]
MKTKKVVDASKRLKRYHVHKMEMILKKLKNGSIFGIYEME